jgi:hypothetical protein
MSNDLHPWRATIVLGLLAIAAGMVASMCVEPALGHNHWWIPADAWLTLRAAHYVPQGTYPLIYEAGTTRGGFDAGPLLPLLLAPVAWIGDLFHLHESYPFPRQRPSMWVVFGPYSLACAIPLLYATRALATQLVVRRRRALLQGAVLLIAFVPMAIVYGHYEDVLALALVFIAFRDLFAERPLRGALYLAAAIAFKQWSLLAVPVFVAACPAGVRVQAARRAVLPPAVFLAAFLALDYKYATIALLHPPAFPQFGHPALWISPTTSELTNVPERAGAFVVAFVVAWLIRRERNPAFILSALGCVLLSRFLFEPVVHAYYLAPGIAALLVSEWSRRRSIVTNFTLGAALLLAFPFHPARGLWWLVVYALVALVLYGPVVRLVRRSMMDRDEVKTATTVRPAVFAADAPASSAGTM